MVLTRTEKTEILQHLLNTVLDIDPDAKHPIRISFSDHQIDTIDDFESLEIDDINALTYTKFANDKTVKVLPLPPGSRGNLRHLLKYVRLVIVQYNDSNNMYPPTTHWKSLTWDAFQIYKANPTPLPSLPTRSSTTSTAITSVNFKKSIKRDASIYPELKDILHFNTWKVQFEALIAKDQLGHVIDSFYSPPPNSDEAVTFRLQQDFVFSVFATKLKAAEAKQIVLAHVNDNDAQQVYKKLRQEAMKSAHAGIERDKHSLSLTPKPSIADGKEHKMVPLYIGWPN